MKSLNHIKDCYAIQKNFKSWAHFCQVANDDLFIRAVDDVALLYAAEQATITVVQHTSKTVPFRSTTPKGRRGRNPFTASFSN